MGGDYVRLRIAVCQILVIDGDREGNFCRMEYALKTAQRAQAQFATFPESSILGWQNPDAHAMAAPIPGADSERIAALARRYGLTIAIGLDEKFTDSLYDAAVLIDKTGRLLWKHRKLNVMPELMNPPYAAGTVEGIGVAATDSGRIGMLICADTFVDAYALQVERSKPDLMLIPYGWAAPRPEWPEHGRELERLVSARAKLWGCPVVGTNSVGAISQGPWRGWTYGGASVIADGDGTVLTVLRDRDADVQVVDIPLRNAPR